MFDRGDASTIVTEGTVSSSVTVSSVVSSFFVAGGSVEIVSEGLGEGVCVTEDISAAEWSNEFDRDAPSLR